VTLHILNSAAGSSNGNSAGCCSGEALSKTGTWMEHEARSLRSSRLLLPIAAGALAIGIFVIDTFTPLEAAVAVLYVVAETLGIRSAKPSK
jgi:hypothetical protein